MEQETVVIGVHGLLNKPEKALLKSWWSKSIIEGVHRNHEKSGSFEFDLAYWADVRYKPPIPESELDEKYECAGGIGPLPRHEANIKNHIRGELQSRVGKLLDKKKNLTGLGENVERILCIKAKDLAEYYDKKNVRDEIRSKLIEVLDRYRNMKIILVGHSMGSIIAYDVLRLRSDSTATHIEHFITIGSPLGLPIVAHNIRSEFGSKRTPNNVLNWTNISDPEDNVALDFNLGDEFESFSGVQVRDVLTHNGYENREGKKNCHKSFGYLRSPEFSDIMIDSKLF